MRKWVAVAVAGLVAVSCSTSNTSTTNTPTAQYQGTQGAYQERTLVRQSETPSPVWIDHIHDYQKQNADMIYASGGVQSVRDREDGKRDAEMIAKRALAELLGQRLISLYLSGRSGQRDADNEEYAKLVREAIGASADQVLVGARPLRYYWEEWRVPQQTGPVQVRYQVNALVGLDKDAARDAAAALAARASERLRREHRAQAAELVEEMRDRLSNDPNASRNILAGFGG